MSNQTRRAILAGAAMLPALAVPAFAAPTADAKLIALGRRYEKLLLKYVDEMLQWAPLHRAAKDETRAVRDTRQAAIDRLREDPSAPYPFDQIRGEIDALNAALQCNGCDAVETRMSKIFERMEPIAEAIKDAPATSLGGLRAKTLVVLLEVWPGGVHHDGELDFPDDGGAMRSLFDAAAELTGLTPMVRELERRLAADATVEEAAA